MSLKLLYKLKIHEKLHTGMYTSEHQNEALEFKAKR